MSKAQRMTAILVATMLGLAAVFAVALSARAGGDCETFRNHSGHVPAGWTAMFYEDGKLYGPYVGPTYVAPSTAKEGNRSWDKAKKCRTVTTTTVPTTSTTEVTTTTVADSTTTTTNHSSSTSSTFPGVTTSTLPSDTTTTLPALLSTTSMPESTSTTHPAPTTAVSIESTTTSDPSDPPGSPTDPPNDPPATLPHTGPVGVMSAILVGATLVAGGMSLLRKARSL